MGIEMDEAKKKYKQRLSSERQPRNSPDKQGTENGATTFLRPLESITAIGKVKD